MQKILTYCQYKSVWSGSGKEELSLECHTLPLNFSAHQIRCRIIRILCLMCICKTGLSPKLFWGLERCFGIRNRRKCTKKSVLSHVCMNFHSSASNWARIFSYNVASRGLYFQPLEITPLYTHAHVCNIQNAYTYMYTLSNLCLYGW